MMMVATAGFVFIVSKAVAGRVEIELPVAVMWLFSFVADVALALYALSGLVF